MPWQLSGWLGGSYLVYRYFRGGAAMRALFCLILSSVFLGGWTARAQDAPHWLPPALRLDSGKVTYTPWTKLCSAVVPEKSCATSRWVLSIDGRDGVFVSLTEAAGASPKVRLAVVLGADLRQGLHLTVDGSKWISTEYRSCDSHGCIAEIEATDALISNLSRGQSAAVAYYKITGQQVLVIVPLAGFSAAFRGPPAEPDTVPVHSTIDWSSSVQWDRLIQKRK